MLQKKNGVIGFLLLSQEIYIQYICLREFSTGRES